MKLENNTILITGGTRGIGLEMAKALAAQKNKVIVTGRNQANLDKVKTENPELIPIQSDVSDLSQIDALFVRMEKEHSDLNFLINNAGIANTMSLQKHGFGGSALTHEIDVNVKGPIYMVDRFLPLLERQPEPAIMNVSSGLAYVPFPSYPIYCATKAALHSYTQSLRVQLQGTPIRVFELMPPAVDTEMTADFNDPSIKKITPEQLTRAVLRGIKKDHWEIRPGLASQLYFMSRFFPRFIFNQMAKPALKILSSLKALPGPQ